MSLMSWGIFKMIEQFPGQLGEFKKFHFILARRTLRGRREPDCPRRNLVVGQPGDEDETIQTRTLSNNLNDFGGQHISHRSTRTQASECPLEANC